MMWLLRYCESVGKLSLATLVTLHVRFQLSAIYGRVALSDTITRWETSVKTIIASRRHGCLQEHERFAIISKVENVRVHWQMPITQAYYAT